MRKSWSPEEVKKLKKHMRNGVSGSDISKELNRSQSSVYQKMKTIRLNRKNNLSKSPGVELDLIMNVVSEYYGLKIINIVQKDKSEIFRVPRQICHTLSKKYTSYSNAHVGFNIGRLSHTIVSNSRKKVSQYLETDKKFRSEFNEIDLIVKNKIENLNHVQSDKEKSLLIQIKSLIFGINNKIAFNELVKELRDEK